MPLKPLLPFRECLRAATLNAGLALNENIGSVESGKTYRDKSSRLESSTGPDRQPMSECGKHLAGTHPTQTSTFAIGRYRDISLVSLPPSRATKAPEIEGLYE